MYILPTLTYLEVGGPADASEIICFEHFKWEPITEPCARLRPMATCRTMRPSLKPELTAVQPAASASPACLGPCLGCGPRRDEARWHSARRW